MSYKKNLVETTTDTFEQKPQGKKIVPGVNMENRPRELFFVD